MQYERGDKILVIDCPEHPGIIEKQAIVDAVESEFLKISIVSNQIAKRIHKSNAIPCLVNSVAVIHSLVLKPQWNGSKCEVFHYDETITRYIVRVASGKTKKIKRQNLKLYASRLTDFLRADFTGSLAPEITFQVFPSWRLPEILAAGKREDFFAAHLVPEAAVREDKTNRIVWVSTPRKSPLGSRDLQISDPVLDRLLLAAGLETFIALPEFFAKPELPWLMENLIKSYALLVGKSNHVLILGERNLCDWQLVDETVAKAHGIPVSYVKCGGFQDFAESPESEALRILDVYDS